MKSLNPIGNTGNLPPKMINVKNLRNNKVMKIRKFKQYKRRVEICLDPHNEKLRKIRLILKIGNKKHWKIIKNEVEALKSQIKREVEICKQKAREEYEKRHLKQS